MSFIKFLFRKSIIQSVTRNNLVFITGCDSGLGFNLAKYCHSLGMTVVTGCLNQNSDGIKILQTLHDSERIIPLKLNLLKPDSIENSYKFINNLLTSKNEYILTGLINNAGMMVFGEYDWLADDMIEQQININLLGPMKLTKKFLPLIFQNKTRIINITSHCGFHSLPGLAPYSASKAGFRNFNDSLRMELNKYGIHVVNFVPGSFVMSSNITAQQQNYAIEMKSKMSSDQIKFYGHYFDTYMGYLKIISGYKKPSDMNDEELLNKMRDALLAKEPKALYIHEPWRYKLYYNLFKVMPTSISDVLTQKFIMMPKYIKQ